MKKLLTLLTLLCFTQAFSQTIDIGPDEYAFQYTVNPNFGLFFNASNTQYEFRNGLGVPVLSFNANSGILGTDLEFQQSVDYLVSNNRYAFRAKSDPDFGLFFNAATLSYDFRDNSGNAAFSIGANSGNLETSGYILPGNTSSGTEGSIRFNGTDLQGRIGGQWISLTAAATGGNDLQEAYEANNVIIADQGSVTIEGTDGIVVSGTSNLGLSPSFGAVPTSVMYFSPNRSAFRAGFVSNGNWDETLAGRYSAAFGSNTLAVGVFSFAAGDSSLALGSHSAVFGEKTLALANAAAFGRNTNASGFGSFAMGNGSSTVSGAEYAFAGGFNSTASASNAMSFGFGTSASGLASTAFGYQADASGQWSLSVGLNTAATGNSSIALGENIESNATASFAAGSGVIASGFASIAMGDGTESTGEASFAAGLASVASGDASSVFGEGNQATEQHAFAAGENNIASGAGAGVFGRSSESSGNYSFASGNGSTASGSSAVAMGSNTDASGSTAVAFGFSSNSEEFGSFAAGIGTTASGEASLAFGRGTTAKSAHEVVIGSYNTDYTPLSISSNEDNDRLFVIGNGTGSSNRSDALVMLKNGNMGLGTDNPGTKLTIADVPIGGNGIRLSGGGNYYSTDNWQFGQAQDEAFPVADGDFVMKRVNQPLYHFWNGYFAPVNDNTATLGRLSRRWATIYSSNGSINTSDAREKKNIKDIDYGLETLMKLKPVSYQWKDDAMNMGTKLGFVAQDLLEVVPEVVVTQEPVENRETGEITFEEAERMGVFYDDLIPVLTKAIQEQQATIDDQNESIAELLDAVENLSEENESLKDLLSNVTSKIERVEQDLVSCCFESGSNTPNGSNINENPELGQNIPNPFSESTVIQYYLPENTANAIIRITDMNGSPVEDIRLGEQKGANQVEFHTQGLASGTYLYSLFVDGKFVATNKMMITR